MPETVVTELVIDASPSEAGAARYAAAMAKASTAADRFNQLQQRVADAQTKGAAVMDATAQRSSRLETAYNKLRAQIDPLAAAEQKLAAIREQSAVAASNAVLHGVTTEEAALADLTALDQKHMQQIQAMKDQQASLAGASMPKITGGGVSIVHDLEETTKAAGLTRQQMQSLGHEVRATFDILASGGSPLRALELEGPRLVQAFGEGPGGVAGTFQALGAMLVRFLPVLLPIAVVVGGIAVAVAGLTSAIDRNTGKSVSWMDTLKAVFQSLGDLVKNVLGPATSQITSWFSNFVKWISPGVEAGFNFLVGSFKTAADDIGDIFKLLPSLVGDAAISTVNGVIAVINGMISGVAGGLNNLIGQTNDKLHTNFGVIDQSKLGIGQIDNPYKGATDRVGQQMSANAQSDMSTNYAGAAFGDIQKHALDNAANDNKTKTGSTRLDPFQQALQGAKADTANLVAQQQALGQTTFAASKLEEQQKLINEATKKGTDLSPDQLKAIDAASTAYAEQKSKLEELTAIYDTGKQATEDFASTLKSDLMSGTSLWGAFGDAASKALDDIANKALQMAADGVWDMIFNGINGSGSSSGGSSGGLAGILSSIFHFAGGTDSAPGGMSIVGENGPELMNVPARAQIFTAPQTRQLLAANSNAANSNVTVQIIDQRSGGGTIQQDTITGPNGQKIVRAIVRDEVLQLHRRAVKGF